LDIFRLTASAALSASMRTITPAEGMDTDIYLGHSTR
jgi:hypothetical protein